jgi:hypothetical protein
MKKIIPALMISGIAFAVFAAQGCSRPPAAVSMEFRGRVLYGVENSSGTLIVLGVLPGARVILMNDNTSVVTDASGNYSMAASVPRSFVSNNVEQYTLEAVAPVTWAGTSQRQGVTGRPGDIIYVRDFILFRHYYLQQ